MRLGKRQSLAPVGIASKMSLTCPFADAAFLRNLRVQSRDITPARKIPEPHMIIAPRVSTGNQCSAPLMCRAVRLPSKPGTPRASSKREWFHLFMRDLAYLLSSSSSPLRHALTFRSLRTRGARGTLRSGGSLGSATHLVVRFALCVLDTETPSHLQVLDDGIAAQDANQGAIVYHGQLVAL